MHGRARRRIATIDKPQHDEFDREKRCVAEQNQQHADDGEQ